MEDNEGYNLRNKNMQYAYNSIATGNSQLCVQVRLGALKHLGSCLEENKGGWLARQARVSQQSPTGTDASVNFEQTYRVSTFNFGKADVSTFKYKLSEVTGIYKGADMGVKVFMSSSTGDIKARPD